MMELELLFVGFLLSVTDASCPITLDPPTVVVKYGAPAKIICFATDSDYVQIGWEAPVGGTSPHPISSTPNLEWFVPNVTEWRLAPECYINPPRGSPKKQCSKKARVVVYDVPEEIRLDSDVTSDLAEGRLMLFTCSLNSSVPLTNLTISLYVNDNRTMMPDLKASRHVEAPFHIQASREMNGATVRCGAQVDLQPEVPLISLFSNEIFLNVLYEPVLTCPHNVSIPENAPYNLTCTAEGNPQPQIIWFKDGEEVDLPENLTRGDAGQYLVLASNAFNRTAAATVNIIVTYPPSQILELEDSEVEVGSSVRLKCASKAIPRPGYSWTYYQAENVMVVYEDGVSLLLVENATDFNAGVYTCHTGNIGGSVSKSVKLTVKAKAVSSSCPVEIQPSSIVVKFGDPVSVNCTTTSPRRKNMGWESPQGSTEPEPVSSVLLEIKKLENWLLAPKCFINLASPPFQCYKDLQVTVYKPPERVSISEASEIGPLLEGNKKQIECLVVDVAPPQNLTLSWYIGDTLVYSEPFNKSSQSSTVSGPSFYTWTARKEDNGMGIRCEAKLEFGPTGPTVPVTKSKTEKLTVFYPPQFAEHEETIKLKGSEGLSLNCTVSANPTPKYTWQLPPSLPKQQNQTSQPVLDVSFPMPGTYTCTASNVHGTRTKSFIVAMEAGSPAGTTAGILIAVLFVVIFIAACVVYRKQKPAGVARTENIS
ncbi:vascular cell adhesion protein 1-like isoform 3-T3 [Synchiropus picturatus]